MLKNLEPAYTAENVTKILIVDDSTRYKDALKRRLSLHGYKDIETAESPHEALEIIEEDEFDIVLLDINFDETSKENGIDILPSLRKSCLNNPIVIVSGDESPENFIRAMMSGADDYWVKGVHLKIEREIESMLSKGRTAKMVPLSPIRIVEMGYARTLGLTVDQIETLSFIAKQYMGKEAHLLRDDSDIPKSVLERFYKIFERTKIDKAKIELEQR